MFRYIKLRYVVGTLIAGVILASASSHAQSNAITSVLLKQTPSASKPSSTNANLDSGTPAEQLEKIAKQQNETQKQLDAANTELTKVKNALADLDVKASDAQRMAARQAISAKQAKVDYLSQINDTLIDLSRQTLKATAAEEDKLKWAPPLGTAPWPLAVGDETMVVILQLSAQLHKQERRLDIIDHDLTDQKKQRSQLEIDLRQLNGKVTSSLPTNSASDAGVRAQIEAARDKLELCDLELMRTDLDRLVIAAQRRLTSAQLDVAKLNWNYYNNRFSFSQDDLNTIIASIDKKIVALRKKEDDASNRLNQTVAQAAAAKARLDSIEATPNAAATDISIAKRAWLTLDGTASGVRVEREKYRALIDIENLKKEIWTLRQQIHSKTGAANNLNALQEQQQNVRKKLDQGVQYLNELIEDKAQILASLKEQGSYATTPGEKVFFDGLVKQTNDQMEDLRSIYVETDRLNQLLSISAAEIQKVADNLSIWEKAKKIGQIANNALKSIWNYELLAVDDTVIVDGREIKTTRSVTVGKSLGAIAILFIGFTLITKLIRRTLALAVSKGGLNASRSVIVGRWLTLAAGITLIIWAFNLVEIPLSAFAFFGGALAIGVGFGTQNLLKNLISGVMLLIEKPVRIGDVVEVDNITGTVTSIGIRFSTIHSAHGTDTLIPNSVLVEQKLVNWTYSTPDVRREIKVTVAYGSDVKKVSELILKACDQNAQVLKTPAPLVTLEDFGESGLLFNLQVWLTIQQGTSVARILSDVRLAMLNAFNEAGIDLPFPQRVVRVMKDE